MPSYRIHVRAVQVALHIGDQNALYGEQAPGHLATQTVQKAYATGKRRRTGREPLYTRAKVMAKYDDTDCDGESYGTAETGKCDAAKKRVKRRETLRYVTLRTREKSRYCCVMAM